MPTCSCCTHGAACAFFDRRTTLRRLPVAHDLISLGAASPGLPALVAASGERAGVRFLEFFAEAIRNPHTRRAYSQAVGAFLAWCEAEAGIRSLAAVQPLHVAAWIE